jgi:hypothetical protein
MAFTETRRRSAVEGNRRVVTIAGTVNVSTDTLVTGLKLCEHVSVLSGGAHAIGATVSGGTITFANTTGAVLVRAEGF